MNIKQLQEELLRVRKAKNKIATAVLQSLIADYDKQARTGKNVDILAMVRKYMANAFANNQLELERGNLAGAGKYLSEHVFLNTLLPKQLTYEELRQILVSNNLVNVGEAMQFLRANYNGQYDGKMASALAKEVL